MRLYDFATLHPRLAAMLPPQKPVCTYCGGTSFYQGPQGGLSTNIRCANDECRHWFNHCPGISLDDRHHIEPKDMDA